LRQLPLDSYSYRTRPPSGMAQSGSSTETPPVVRGRPFDRHHQVEEARQPMNNTDEGDSGSAAVEASARVMSAGGSVPATASAPPAPAPASLLSSNNLSAVSGAALGSLLGYVKEFGTPYQSARAGRILDCLSRLGKHPTLLIHSSRSDEEQEGDPRDTNAREMLSTIGGISENGDIDCPVLRQHLYEIAGDWLWTHACSSFRHTVAKDAAIPPDLREEALRLSKPISMDDERILNDQDARERGYFSFTGYLFPGSEAYYV